MPAPRALLILGMHRSGTSALARMLCTLGVDFGSGHLPAGPSNELGFFEKAAVADADERLLQALGLSGASDPRPLPPRWLEHPAVATIRADLVEQLRDDFAGAPLWGVKDPRICRRAPLWIEVVRALDCEPAFVHITRHPLEVADSLRARQGLPLRSAQLLWLRHVLEGERATRGHVRVFVGYDELLAGWRETAARIADALGLRWPVDPDALADGDAPALPQRLRHHQRSDDALGEEEGAARWVAGAYRALLRARQDDEPGPVRRLDEIRRNLDAAEELLAGEMAAVPPPEGDAPPLRYSGRLRWDQGQLDARATVGEIVDGSVVEISLVAGHGGFCGFDLLFGTFARTNTSSLEVTLEIEDSAGALGVVQRWSISAAEIENDRWRAFRCPPQVESLGRRCRVRVAAPGAAPGDAVTVYCDPEGHPAFRAYFAELSAPDETTVAEPSLRALEERAQQLEEEARLRDARLAGLTEQLEQLAHDGRALPQVVDWSGRVPGLEERVGRLEQSGVSRDSMAELQQRVAALEPRIEGEMGAARAAVLELRHGLESVRADLGSASGDLQAEAERMRVELAEQRGRIAPLGEQLRALHELYGALRDAGDEARREQRDRLDEVEGRLASALEAMRREEATLRDALEELDRAQGEIHESAAQRVEAVERAQLDHAQRQLGAAERLDRLETVVLSAMERIDALHRRADRDLAAIGEALEEAFG